MAIKEVGGANPFEQTASAPEGTPLGQTVAGAFDATQALPSGQVLPPIVGPQTPTAPPPAQPPPAHPPAPSAVGGASSSNGPVSGADMAFLRPFGPFARVEPLAEQGAMGLVARGYNAAFDRWELLKFLRGEYAQNPELLRQFQREGRILAKLSHPNVVQVFAIYALDGRPCLAMEFLEGESLERHAQQQPGGRLSVARWQDLFLAAARGLAAAHEVGLLHRDLKPANLFVLAERKGSSGTLKLIDFGLATADRSKRDQAHDPSLVAGMSGGTPLYMAPELWGRQEGSPRSDLYALGLTFYVALTGRLPYEVGRTMHEVASAVCDERPFLDARDLRPELPAPLAAVLRRCIAKRPEDRFVTADELVAALVAAAAATRARHVPGSGPYRGLGSFSAAERDVFFGREAEVAEVLERLRAAGGLVLVGPSGSGKSSLAHAGVVPAIEEGALGNGLVYRPVRFEPRDRPLASLAAALGAAVATPEKELLAFLRATPERLGEALRSGLPPGVGVLVVVDQMEELATLAQSDAEVQQFARAVGSLVEVASPELRLLATLRADLMDRLFALEPLRPLLTRGFYPVRPLLGDGLRRALLGPAQTAGYSLEDPTIADAIVDDVARTPAGLPLMSFAMAAWWQARDEARKVLPTAAWRALGGLGGALARHGDSVLASLSAEELHAAEQILLRLVSADGTRARAARSSLVDPAAAGPHAARALDRLLAAKLLHESEGEIELIHEALISQWPALRKLLASSGEDRAFRERVAAAARQWDAQGRPDGALWSDDQAARLLRWFAATPSALDQTELGFIEAVRRRISGRKLLVRSGVFAALALALTFGLVTKRSERDLQAKLHAVSTRAAQLEGDYRRAEAARLRSLAERQLNEDPATALATAFQSYEKLPTPALDMIAWRARFRGLPFPLPLHHRGAAFALFSSNDAWIATGGGDGSVRVLSASGHETASIRPSRDDSAVPRSVAFSDEALGVGSSVGELVVARPPKFSPSVVGRCKGPVEHLKAAAGGSFYARCQGPSGAQLLRVGAQADEMASGDLVGLDASADGALVASARRSGKLLLATAAASPVEFPLPAAGVEDVALAPDGSRVFVAEHDGTVRWAPIAGGKPGSFTAFAEKLAGPPVAFAAGPDGALLAIGPDRQARLWLGSSRSLSFESGSHAFAWSARRHLLLLSDAGDDALIISLLTGELLGRLQGATAALHSLRANSEGTWALAASADGATRAYSLDSAAGLISRGRLPTPPSACAMAPDGTAAACVVGRELQIEPVQGSVGGPKAARSLPLPADVAPTRVAVGPKGELASWASAGRWGLGEAALDGVATPTSLATDGRTVALAGKAQDGSAALLLARAPAGPSRPVALDEHPAVVAFSPDGHRLAAATDEGNVLLIDVETAKIFRVLALGAAQLEGEPTALSFTDDGAQIAVGSRGGVIATVAAEGRSPPRRVTRLGAPVTCLAWAQPGRALSVALADRRRIVLDADTALTFFQSPTATPTVACARSPIDDRFSSVFASGAVSLRLIDTAPLTMSKAPEPTLDPRTMPFDHWRGLPAVWR